MVRACACAKQMSTNVRPAGGDHDGPQRKLNQQNLTAILRARGEHTVFELKSWAHVENTPDRLLTTIIRARREHAQGPLFELKSFAHVENTPECRPLN